MIADDSEIISVNLKTGTTGNSVGSEMYTLDKDVEENLYPDIK